MLKRGVLLINLGSPNSPTRADVRKYLNEFLMDPYVIDLPWIMRFILVSLLITPFRSIRSARAYKKIWTKTGSPLVAHGQQLAAKLTQKTGLPVQCAMRYGQPSIAQSLLYFKHIEVSEIILFPLYPHYAMSSVQTVIEKTKLIAKQQKLSCNIRILSTFYRDVDYIDSLIRVASPWLIKGFDHLVFSFHGIPINHIMKSDRSKKHCLKVKDCCNTAATAHRTCYRHQTFHTARDFANRANIPPEKYTVSFQSRLGRNKWLTPDTVSILEKLAQKGAKKVLVICPSFVADCLETLEEIHIEAKSRFIAAGGTSMTLIPCLNTHPSWVNLLTKWMKYK